MPGPGKAPVNFPCTCFCQPVPGTGRLGIEIYDPFCLVRQHRVAASTNHEPTYRQGSW